MHTYIQGPKSSLRYVMKFCGDKTTFKKYISPFELDMYLKARNDF